MKHNVLSLIAFMFILQSCAAHVSHKQIINKEPLLIGTVSRQELFTEFPVFKTNYDSYVPNDSVIQKLKSYSGNVHIEIFLGTWCGDTKRNLPSFLKAMDRAGLRTITYTLHALDRTKKDKEKLTAKYSVSRVPTMVFLKSEKEIGRITESPVKSVEEDMLSILQR